MASLRGHLLAASQRLSDPNFAQTVVLIVRHDEAGALGLILNRPLEVSVADACGPDIPAAADIDERLHQGGPCEGPLMVLHRGGEAGDAVMDGVRFTARRDEIERLMLEEARPVKYFAGYSGWSAQQLEGEIAEGAWLVAPAESDDVFRTPEDHWSRTTTRLMLGRWIDPDRLPENPHLN